MVRGGDLAAEDEGRCLLRDLKDGEESLLRGWLAAKNSAKSQAGPWHSHHCLGNLYGSTGATSEATLTGDNFCSCYLQPLSGLLT